MKVKVLAEGTLHDLMPVYCSGKCNCKFFVSGI